MKNISNQVMEIITTIQQYIDKTGNKEVIDKYYQTYSTYIGIVEYLNGVDDTRELLKRSILNDSFKKIFK